MTKATSWPIAFALVSVFACGKGERLDPATDKLGRATGPVEPVGERVVAKPSGKRGAMHKGKVLETIEVARYTYLHIETTDGSKLWAAVPKPQTKIEEGRSVEVIESMVMTDFKSPSLNRTFPSVVFGVLSDRRKTTADAGSDSST